MALAVLDRWEATAGRVGRAGGEAHRNARACAVALGSATGSPMLVEPWTGAMVVQMDRGVQTRFRTSILTASDKCGEMRLSQMS